LKYFIVLKGTVRPSTAKA